MTEIMWAILGEHGFYTGTALTRKEMIQEHCAAYSEYFRTPRQLPYAQLKRIWRKCRKNGDRAVKVELKQVTDTGKKPIGKWAVSDVGCDRC